MMINDADLCVNHNGELVSRVHLIYFQVFIVAGELMDANVWWQRQRFTTLNTLQTKPIFTSVISSYITVFTSHYLVIVFGWEKPSFCIS